MTESRNASMGSDDLKGKKSLAAHPEQGKPGV